MMSINPRHKTDVEFCCSPDRTKEWVEPELIHKRKSQRKVPVVYYLSQNGRLEHPHFIEVEISLPEGLYLRDVMNRLNHLRGLGIADMYAWSSKRAYKTGYVWQDLSKNDMICPSHGHEYILKGSRLLESSLSFRSIENTVPLDHTNSSGDLEHTKICMAKTEGGLRGRSASNNASTQTEGNGLKAAMVHCSEDEVEELYKEISPPPCSNGSSGELGRVSVSGLAGADIRNQITESDRPSGRLKPPAVLMQLIICGSKNGEDIISPQARD